jgi:3-deoxy-D-manno-octulosonic acid (KDO) 8-phosphate synthase
MEEVARELVRLQQKYDLDIYFKASFDKANRTSLSSFRGPGMERGLQMLADIKEKFGLRLVTDIHESCQAEPVGRVVDVVQIDQSTHKRVLRGTLTSAASTDGSTTLTGTVCDVDEEVQLEFYLHGYNRDYTG